MGLTRERVIDSAVELLDESGEAGLTFRALALRLRTGHGAIQWHVRNKSELLTAAATATLARALIEPAPETPPNEAVRAIGLGVFTAIEAHPWLSGQLFAAPWQSPMVKLWEQIARPVEQMGVPSAALFTAVSTLVNYITGAGSQNAVNTSAFAAETNRESLLNTVADHWERFDPRQSSVIGRLAAQLRLHDDREELLAGIDIILAGLATTRQRSGQSSS